MAANSPLCASASGCSRTKAWLAMTDTWSAASTLEPPAAEHSGDDFEEHGSVASSGGCRGDSHPTLQNALPETMPTELPEDGSLPPGCVTVMVRHVPVKYQQEDFATEICAAGFQGLFNLFYLPKVHAKKRNRGFAFINFVTAEAATQFHLAFHGRRLLHHPLNAKPLAVVPAETQGMEATAYRLFASDGSDPRPRPRNSRECQPILLGDGGEQAAIAATSKATILSASSCIPTAPMRQFGNDEPAKLAHDDATPCFLDVCMSCHAVILRSQRFCERCGSGNEFPAALLDGKPWSV